MMMMTWKEKAYNICCQNLRSFEWELVVLSNYELISILPQHAIYIYIYIYICPCGQKSHREQWIRGMNDEREREKQTDRKKERQKNPCQQWDLMMRIYIFFTPSRNFHIYVSRWSSTWFWGTASLIKSQGLFSVFWSFSIML